MAACLPVVRVTNMRRIPNALTGIRRRFRRCLRPAEGWSMPGADQRRSELAGSAVGDEGRSESVPGGASQDVAIVLEARWTADANLLHSVN